MSTEMSWLSPQPRVHQSRWFPVDSKGTLPSPDPQYEVEQLRSELRAASFRLQELERRAAGPSMPSAGVYATPLHTNLVQEHSGYIPQPQSGYQPVSLHPSAAYQAPVYQPGWPYGGEQAQAYASDSVYQGGGQRIMAGPVRPAPHQPSISHMAVPSFAGQSFLPSIAAGSRVVSVPLVAGVAGSPGIPGPVSGTGFSLASPALWRDSPMDSHKSLFSSDLSDADSTTASSVTEEPDSSKQNSSPETSFKALPLVEAPAFHHISANTPINYRELLEPNATCNWSVVVDRILQANDQQASILLQQKMKVATEDQRPTIMACIITRAFKLTVHRFGNFLVQRCFECGTAEQVSQLALALRNRIASLSANPFGCHVVQKALESVCFDTRMHFVTEMLNCGCIRDSIVHRFSSHVWLKLIQMGKDKDRTKRWDGDTTGDGSHAAPMIPPGLVIGRLHQELKGLWSVIAIKEIGSLVVQNIFESYDCTERISVIDEIVAHLQSVVTGQYGNFVIQHIVEHAPSDHRRLVADSIANHIVEYGIHPQAVKVVRKTVRLWVSDVAWTQRVVDKLVRGSTKTPPSALVQMSQDSQGSEVVLTLLASASPTQKRQVADHVRKFATALKPFKAAARVMQAAAKIK